MSFRSCDPGTGEEPGTGDEPGEGPGEDGSSSSGGGTEDIADDDVPYGITDIYGPDDSCTRAQIVSFMYRAG